VSFDEARAVADAVLFEGYALYPYRPSSAKNQVRWQFGVLAPRAWSEAGGGDAWWQETQCLVEAGDGGERAEVRVRLRFLQLRRAPAPATAPSAAAPPWDEGEVREVDFTFRTAPTGAAHAQTASFFVAGGTDGGPAGARRRCPISGVVKMTVERAAASEPLLRLCIRVENVTPWAAPAAPRHEALSASMLGTHLLLEVSSGRFVSLLDPPPGAAADAAAGCRNVRTYPVLAGPAGRRDLVLSSPVILYDHPAVAPESPGDLFDATEIDEILTLRTLTLTDDEKREARATDPRIAALLDRVERLGPEEMTRLHGAIRELRPLAPVAGPEVVIGGVTVAAGSRVRLRPGPRRTDAQDMFLAGLTARVEAVMRDVDDRDCLAVTVEDDPAADLLREHGRYLYFYPDEVEALP
jgi:hypothetical protein